MPSRDSKADVAVIGAGIAGISTAYSLAIDHGITAVVLVDAGQPMAFTSAQSGENYRNWWPHPSMAALTNRSIDLMERIARRTGNRIDMTRRGYAAATRRTDIDDLMEQLQFGFGDPTGQSLRVHSAATAPSYRPARSRDWNYAPAGVDVLRNQHLIREVFDPNGIRNGEFR